MPVSATQVYLNISQCIVCIKHRCAQTKPWIRPCYREPLVSERKLLTTKLRSLINPSRIYQFLKFFPTHALIRILPRFAIESPISISKTKKWN